jgi:hypothetical protein
MMWTAWVPAAVLARQLIQQMLLNCVAGYHVLSAYFICTTRLTDVLAKSETVSVSVLLMYCAQA